MDGLIEGRLCHYVAYNNRHLAAIVIGTGVIDISGQAGTTDFLVMTNIPVADLAVFTNLETVTGNKNYGLQFHADVRFSDTKEPGTWHWIEPAFDKYTGNEIRV